MSESDQNGTHNPSEEIADASRDLRAAARSAAEAGASLEEIAAQLGIDPADVASLLEGA